MASAITSFFILVIPYILYNAGLLSTSIFNERLALALNLIVVNIVYLVMKSKQLTIAWWLIVSGVVLNSIVVLLNNGMPGNHVPFTDATKLRILADVIPVGNLFIISIGDIFTIAGLIWFAGMFLGHVFALYDRVTRLNKLYKLHGVMPC